MSFSIDFFDDGHVLEWETTADGAVATEREDYSPRFYVAPRDPDVDIDLTTLQSVYDQHPDIVATETVARRPGFRRDEETVLAVDVTHIDRVTPLARQARQLSEYPVGDLACFNVDFSREFRYCLETGADPTPASELSTLRLSVPLTETSNDSYGELSVAGDTVTGSPADILSTVETALEAHNPDVLVCSTSEIVPTLYEMATDAGVDDFSLSRWPDVDYQQLASRSTYSSYGRVGHSPARYNVPGRAIIDESNTFFYGETNLDGVLDLVSRSKKPIQELAWASIGNVLTAIQICEAHDRDVLVPWNSWRHEFYKSMGTLHDADRGGFIFAPEVGLHENVHELDFSSLYPNIICTRNVSPDVIRCGCHERDDVPGLRYSICDERGYLVDVLQPIIDARDEIKAKIRHEENRDDPDEDRLAELEGQSGALKWILVACFGYQGFSNAKFGRIECHEAINAFAREILLTAKQRLEAGGWRVVHGIVDSIWVTPNPDVDDDGREDLETLATEISDAAEIRLEHEAHYDWVAFVPQRESDAGALTKYFGKEADSEEFKIRGIEARQGSTPPFIEDIQRACLDRLDTTRSPDAVLGRLERAINELWSGTVSVERLVERNRVSKPLEGYTQNTLNVAALKRARDQDLAVHPGQDIEYVVVDNEKSSRDRVALAHEDINTYDASYYEVQLVRAVESILSPLGWDRTDIRRELDGTQIIGITNWS
jgi:DNA polymerase I